MPKRKLENSKHRPAPASQPTETSAIRLHPEMTPPRLDCLARTERFELLNPETRGKRWGDWRLIFIAERSGLPVRLERHCRHAEIWAGGSIRDPAPLAMVPPRGFGGDGAGAVATEKDPQMSHGKTPTKTEVARAKSRANRP